MKTINQRIITHLNAANIPLHVECIRVSCEIGNWNTALKHCLELVLSKQIEGERTSNGWILDQHGGKRRMSDEDLATIALLEYLNACEAGIAAAKHLIKEAKIDKNSEYPWSPEKIKWAQAEGAQGPYERSDDVNSSDFKALLKDLATHQGKLTRDSYFYWTFQNGATVGRKKQKKLGCIQ